MAAVPLLAGAAPWLSQVDDPGQTNRSGPDSDPFQELAAASSWAANQAREILHTIRPRVHSCHNARLLTSSSRLAQPRTGFQGLLAPTHGSGRPAASWLPGRADSSACTGLRPVAAAGSCPAACLPLQARAPATGRQVDRGRLDQGHGAFLV